MKKRTVIYKPYELGYVEGSTCQTHPDQYIADRWEEYYHGKVISYSEFIHYRKGFIKGFNENPDNRTEYKDFTNYGVQISNRS